VVGRKKYAYDIWGSTVNIASRMESNGEPGQVNISAETYNCIKDQFSCTHRGKIWAKSVGEIDMYFVDSESQSVFIPQERKETEIVLSISQQGVSPQNIGI
jgi:adenylate cyclase